MSDDQRPAHEVLPEPDADTATARDLSTWHYVRAAARHQLLDHLASGDDHRQMGRAAMAFNTEFALGWLYDRVSDERARQLRRLLVSGDTPPELLWESLAARGIDPDGIRRYPTDAEVSR